jgi:hypothetical protein
LPREHGAYAEVAFPLITALALGSFSLAPLLLAAATVAVFLAHEPLLVITGERGRRTQTEMGERAWRAAALLGAFALASGGLGWWIAAAGARLAVLLPLALGAMLIPLILGRREKTIGGELLVALTFSSTLIPVALAGGVSPRAALTASGVWFAVFALGTLTVRAVIARVKKNMNPAWLSRAIVALTLVVILAAILLRMTATMPTLAAVAVIPSALVALTCGLLSVHPRHLRKMGWSLVASNFLTLAALLIALR